MRRARALLLVLSLLPAAMPARATVCIADPQTHAVSLLFQPSCVQGALIFRQKDGDSVDTWITDSWPGWGGAEEKCSEAVKGIRSWGNDILVVSTVGGKIGFPGVDKWGFLELTPGKDCYAWRSSGAPEESLKALKQVKLSQFVDKGAPAQ